MKARNISGDLSVSNCKRGGTGFIIAGALLLFLLQPKIKATFA